MANYYGTPAIVTDGLVFAVDAGNGQSYVSGSSTCNSLVSSVTGSLFNDVSGSLGSPKAWEFDGVDDYIQFSQNTAGQFTRDVMSFECWINTDTATNNVLVMDRSLYNGVDGIEIWVDTNRNICVRGGQQAYICSNSALTLDVWYNVVVTYNSTTGQIYINGQLDKSGTIGAVTGNSTYNMYLGRYGDSNLYEWDGKMASIKIYHKVLSASENATKNRFI